MPDTFRTRYFALLAALLSCYLLIGLSARLWFWPGALMRFEGLPVLPDLYGVARGASFSYQFSYCRDGSGGVVVLAREFMRPDAAAASVVTIVPLPEIMISLPTGCHTVRMPMTAPTTLVPGRYQLRLTFVEVGTARRREAAAETDLFTVTD